MTLKTPESVAERLISIELQMLQDETTIRDLKKRLDSAEIKLQYYDKMALKAGFFSMGFLCFGAALAMGADKLKEKIINLVIP